MPLRCRFTPYKKQPRHRYTGKEEQPDIVVLDSDERSNSDLDITLAHLWSMKVLSQSARRRGFLPSGEKIGNR